MTYEKTAIAGVFLVTTTKSIDPRGSFTRVYESETLFVESYLVSFNEDSISQNTRAGTFRGMHYQESPFGEVKLVRCVRGSVIDFVLDLRPESETYLKSASFEISSENAQAVLIPKGIAHGFLTLEDQTDLYYKISGKYNREASKGIRYNDPAITMKIPSEIKIISERDLGFPLLEI